MPKIPDHYLSCVVFLYASEAKARAGNTEDGGTGFFLNVFLGTEAGETVYVITNRHCADQRPTMRLPATDGEWRYITPDREEWLDHPDGDDLSAYPVELGPEFARPRSVPLELVDGVQFIPGVAPGTDAFISGRYVTLSGITQNTPMLRFGNIAMMPAPIEANGRWQESYIVEVRSRSGFSGSPVFAYSLQTQNDERLRIPDEPPPSYWKTEAQNIVFLGVVWGHLDEWEPVYTEKRRGSSYKRPDHYVTHNSNLACVVPAWKVNELLNRSEL